MDQIRSIFARVKRHPARKEEPPHEDSGSEKRTQAGAADEWAMSTSQHIGNATYGLSCIPTITANLSQITSLPGIKSIPGLNLGASLIESYNCVKHARSDDHMMAANSAANATSCFAEAAQETATLSLLFPDKVGRVLGKAAGEVLAVGQVFGIIGGSIALGLGVCELREAARIEDSMGKAGTARAVDASRVKKTRAFGYLDVLSGAAVNAGILSAVSGMPTLGAALLITSAVADIGSLGVWYFMK
ncbi:MAG: hypothetical protein HYU64_14915 [Armatimonadetes bacterium]|nr:hypothetical protein [Armatimonadota bacterium]